MMMTISSNTAFENCCILALSTSAQWTIYVAVCQSAHEVLQSHQEIQPMCWNYGLRITQNFFSI